MTCEGFFHGKIVSPRRCIPFRIPFWARNGSKNGRYVRVRRVELADGLNVVFDAQSLSQPNLTALSDR